MTQESLIISGSSHQVFAEAVAIQSGIPLGKVSLSHFPDGEIFAQILENVRGKTVFVVQSIAFSPNEYLMELCILIDALKRASAAKIIVVIPYYGYCRQDRKDKGRVPITAKLVANFLETAGANSILTMDLHADQIQGFFNIPVDNLFAKPVFAKAYETFNLTSPVVVAPDLGSVKLAKAMSDVLEAAMATIDKRRIDATHVEISPLMGNVRDKDVILVDDMCSTGGTIIKAAKLCKEKGAKRVFVQVTHALLVGDCAEKLKQAPIDYFLHTDTVPIRGRGNFHPVTVVPLFAKAMKCLLSTESISSLLNDF